MRWAALPRLLLLAALSVALVGTGYVATRRVARQLEAAKVCGAVRQGNWSAALAQGEGAAGPDPDGRIAAECLCWAYAASERLDDCVALLERILSNLIANAIRYTDSGSILVGCRRVGSSPRIEVRDTGRGIASEHLDRIFDEFYQVSDARKLKKRGLGLGLNIVKRLAELGF